MRQGDESPVSPGVFWQETNIRRDEREQRNGHPAAVIWLTGMSGAGKTTIARAVERRFFEQRCSTVLLDGDQVRHGLCGDLGFSPDDRAENIRRVGEVAKLFFEQGAIVLLRVRVALPCPSRSRARDGTWRLLFRSLRDCLPCNVARA